MNDLLENIKNCDYLKSGNFLFSINMEMLLDGEDREYFIDFMKGVDSEDFVEVLGLMVKYNNNLYDYGMLNREYENYSFIESEVVLVDTTESIYDLIECYVGYFNDFLNIKRLQLKYPEIIVSFDAYVYRYDAEDGDIDFEQPLSFDEAVRFICGDLICNI